MLGVAQDCFDFEKPISFNRFKRRFAICIPDIWISSRVEERPDNIGEGGNVFFRIHLPICCLPMTNLEKHRALDLREIGRASCRERV